MGQVQGEILPGRVQRSNMEDYSRAVDEFRWEDVDAASPGHETGKVNMAHEAIDRHVDRGAGGCYGTDLQRCGAGREPYLRRLTGTVGISSVMYYANTESAKETGCSSSCRVPRSCISACSAF